MKYLLTSILILVFLTANVFGHDVPSTIDQIKQTGKMRIGFRESEPPMSFLDEDGNTVGYSIDLCKRIVTGVKNEVGKEIQVEFVPVTAITRFNALVDNKIDILCGATTKTLSRSKLVDFTQLTFITGASFITLKGNEFVELSSLNGKKVGAISNTTTLEAVRKLLKESLTDANVVEFDTAFEALNALRKGEIVTFTADQVVLIGLVITSEDADKFAFSPQVYSFEPFALATRRNDADFKLIADSVLSKLYRTGQINQIYDKWFGGLSVERPPFHDALYQLNATPE